MASLVVVAVFMTTVAFAKQEEVSTKMKEQVEKIKENKEKSSFKNEKIKVSKEKKIDLKEVEKLREVNNK